MEDTTYFLGKTIQEESELARLIGQSRMMGEVIGDLFPPSVDIDPQTFHRILDIGSGSGDWCLQVAEAYPNCQVVGIDLLATMVNYGKAQASSRNLHNVHFVVMNALQPLEFADETFDLISMRFGTSFVLSSYWGSLFQEFRRLLHPGGALVCTEIDLGITNSMAWGQLLQWLAEVAHIRKASEGKGFSIGTVAMLGKYFQDAQFDNIQYFPYYFDASASSSYHDAWAQDAFMLIHQIKPMVIQWLHVNEEQFEAVAQQGLEEMRRDDFRHVSFLLSVVGKKPLT